MISKHLDKNNLHHAYLIEGLRDEVVPDLTSFFDKMGVKTAGNPDFNQIAIDNFKIDQAFDLRAMSNDKGFSAGKKIFIISANHFTLDAQNVLLKMFEEPIENTHFFLIVPDRNALLKTLVSRFYFIRESPELDTKEAEKFIKMPLNARIEFLKALLAEEGEEDEEGNEIVALNSARTKALNFLNSLEIALHEKFLKNYSGDYLNHFFKVREFLRMPGSSTKTLMESVALVVPVVQ